MAPKHCQPAAYRLFAEQMERLDEPEALWNGAVAISMHEYPRTDLDQTSRALHRLSDRVRGRVASGEPRALLAHAHEVLFQEEGFRGNEENYYHRDNSCLPVVLQTKRGIPITLSLIYKQVLGNLGIQVEGVNSPGHFLVAVQLETSEMLVDPFDEGRVLSREEAFQRIEAAVCADLEHRDELLTRASHRDWLARILRNLQALYQHEKRSRDLEAMMELQALLAEVPG